MLNYIFVRVINFRIIIIIIIITVTDHRRITVSTDLHSQFLGSIAVPNMQMQHIVTGRVAWSVLKNG